MTYSDDQAPVPLIGSKGLPTYVALDTSSSMGPYEKDLNNTLHEIVDTLFSSPRVSDFIHLSIVSFNTAPHIVLDMTEMRSLTALPTVSCGGSTNYAPLFRLLRERIEADVDDLVQDGVKVLRPVVFMLTDGAPTDRPQSEWTAALAELTDKGWRRHPHIITYGFGDAREAVLKAVATLAAYLAEDTEGNQEALASALNSLLNSLVASAQAAQLQVPTEVQGYKSLPLEYMD